MTPSARIQATLELLNEIETVPRPADAITSGYFRARRYIGSHDRAAISSLLYSILRHTARLGWWVERSSPSPLVGEARRGGVPHGLPSELLELSSLRSPHPNPPHKGEGISPVPRQRLLAYLTLAEKKAPKEIEALFGGGKFAPEALNDDEKKLVGELHTHTIEHPEMPDEVKAECPDWALSSLKERFGENFMREMLALVEPAPLDLRVNPLKATREEMLEELKKAGLKALLCPLSKFGIRVAERPNLSNLPMLKTGQLEIQDEGSQLVAALVDAKPGMRVMDFCAGAGGKTLAIAAEMQNKGRIVACDVLAGRLKRSAERFRRAELHNIETRVLCDERDAWLKKQKISFDRVLIDVPCTGSGAWRRNPDARWRSLGPGLQALLKTQADILESAAALVKPGGRLIYATCSLLPEENERQVEGFLERHKEFELINTNKILSLWHSPHPNPPHEGEGISDLPSLRIHFSHSRPRSIIPTGFLARS